LGVLFVIQKLAFTTILGHHFFFHDIPASISVCHRIFLLTFLNVLLSTNYHQLHKAFGPRPLQPVAYGANKDELHNEDVYAYRVVQDLSVTAGDVMSALK
jgi:hypothetical protein